MTRGNTVIVPNSICPQPAPKTERLCNAVHCPPYWEPGDWSRVSVKANNYLASGQLSVNSRTWLTIYRKMFISYSAQNNVVEEKELGLCIVNKLLL